MLSFSSRFLRNNGRRLIVLTLLLCCLVGAFASQYGLLQRTLVGSFAEAVQAAEPKVKKLAPADHPFPDRRKAPSLDGGMEWINTSGPIDLKQLRGKIVILDFWTYCCINCMHVLPVLKKIEHAYPNNVVVIGVHSAKFEGEQDSQNIREAVMRYEIEHPVINDAEHRLWEKFYVNSWPSFRVIDPEGNLIAGSSGEIDFDTFNGFIQKAVDFYRAQGVLDETPVRFDLEASKAASTPLRFPGKVLADEASSRLFIADSNHNRIVVTKLDGTLIDTIGSGVIGAADGSFATAMFDHPQGMALKDQLLYIADTEGHRLRKADLEKKTVTTIAGTGQQGNGFPGLDALDSAVPGHWSGKPRSTKLNSPWALSIHGNDLFIAMAGPHQIWKMPLDESTIGPYAGNSREDIVDGPLLPKQPYQQGFASFAQPSGLTNDGTWLYVADSEGSSIRAVPLNGKGKVKTVIGTSALPTARLFTFGDVDGNGRVVRLQHALDVCYVDDQIYVADTYNNKIKIVDPEKKSSKTIAGDGKPGKGDDPAQFDEPAGLSYAAGKLYVADTNNHLIRTIDLKNGNQVATLEIKGLEPPKIEREPSKPSFPGAKEVTIEPAAIKVEDGAIGLAVDLQLPPGYKINPLAPLKYLVDPLTAMGPVDRNGLSKLTSVEKPEAKFEIRLPVTAATGEDNLKVSVAYYYCQEGSEGLCKAGSVIFTVPLKLNATGKPFAALAHKVE